MSSIHFNPVVLPLVAPTPHQGGAGEPEALAMRYLSMASLGWGDASSASRYGTDPKYVTTRSVAAPTPYFFTPEPPDSDAGSVYNPNPAGVDLLVIDQFKFSPEQTAAGALYTHGQEVSYVADHAKTSADVEVNTLQADPLDQFNLQISKIAESPNPPEVINLSIGLDAGSVFINDFDYFDKTFKANHGADPKEWDSETWDKYKQDVAIVGKAAVLYFEKQQATFTTLLTESIEKLVARGVTVVVAGGNQGQIKELFDSLDLPVPDRMFDGIFLPTLPKGVLFAGASDSNTASAKPADFTSPRNGIDVAADGIDVQVSDHGDVNEGTSFASPQIAALAADLKAQDPTLTPAQIEDIITQSAIPIPGESARLGSGVIDPAKAFALADASVTEITVFETVQAHFDVWETAGCGSTIDGLITMDDVRSVAANIYASSVDRKVAQYLVDHPEMFTSWESSVTGRSDGLLGKTDLTLWNLRKAGGDDTFNYASTVLAEFEKFDGAKTGGLTDGVFDEDDLLAISASPTAYDEMKFAARYIYGDVMFDQLDSALSGKLDGKVTFMDISQWQLQHMTSDSL